MKTEVSMLSFLNRMKRLASAELQNSPDDDKLGELIRRIGYIEEVRDVLTEIPPLYQSTADEGMFLAFSLGRYLEDVKTEAMLPLLRQAEEVAKGRANKIEKQRRLIEQRNTLLRQWYANSPAPPNEEKQSIRRFCIKHFSTCVYKYEKMHGVGAAKSLKICHKKQRLDEHGKIANPEVFYKKMRNALKQKK